MLSLLKSSRRGGSSNRGGSNGRPNRPKPRGPARTSWRGSSSSNPSEASGQGIQGADFGDFDRGLNGGHINSGFDRGSFYDSRYADNDRNSNWASLSKTGLYFGVIMLIIFSKFTNKDTVPDLPTLITNDEASKAFEVDWGWDVIMYDHRPYLFKNDFKAYTNLLVDEEGGDSDRRKLTRRRTNSLKKKKKKDMRKKLRKANTELVTQYVERRNEYLSLADDYKSQNWKKVAGNNNDIRVDMHSGTGSGTGSGDGGAGIIRVSLTSPTDLDPVLYSLDPKYWSKTQKHQDPFFSGWEEVHDLGPVATANNKNPMKILMEGASPAVEIGIGRRTTKRLLTFGRRDMVFATFKEQGDVEGGNGLRWAKLGVLSINHVMFPPKGEGSDRKYTRAFQDMIIELEEVSGEDDEIFTKIRCIMRVDLGGLIPKAIFRKTVGQTGLMAFKAARKEAMKKAGSWKRNSGLFEKSEKLEL